MNVRERPSRERNRTILHSGVKRIVVIVAPECTSVELFDARNGRVQIDGPAIIDIDNEHGGD